MKKITSILLTVLMLLSLLPMATFAEELNAPKLIIDSADATAGDTVSVNVSIKNNPGIVAATINVAFDEGLTLVGAANGSVFPTSIPFVMPKQLSTVGAITGNCNFQWNGSDIDDGDIKDGVMLTLAFSVSDDAEIGDTYSITVSARDNDVVDKNLQTIQLQAVQGKVTIIDYTPGDVNDDGDISMLDTVMVSRFIVDGCKYDPDGYAIRLNEKAADVNDDSSISMLDTVMISRYIVDGCKTDPNGYNITLKSSTKKCQHEMQATAAKDATCTENGNIAYWYCGLCDKYFSDANGSHMISLDNTVIIATGHTAVIDPAVPATDESTGLTEGSHCSVCGSIIVAQEVVPIVEPNTANITYRLVNNDSYLAAQEINNPNPSSYVVGRGLKLSNDIEVPGYTFLGWYDSFAKNATQIKSISANEEDDITLYAHWELYPFSIEYSSEQIPVEINSDKTSYTVDKSLTLPIPQLSGYTFVGWSDGNGNVIKSIPTGTTGNQKYFANWLSDRNQAWTKKTVGEPLIYEDTENNQILFTYEIGEIRNVPINVIHDFGKVNQDGVPLEVVTEFSETVSATEMNSYTTTVSKATTDSFGWSLSNGWSDQLSVNEEVMQQNQITDENELTRCRNESNNWYVSSGNSGTDTTTTYGSTDEHDLKTTTKNTKKYDNTNTQTSKNTSIELDLESKQNAQIKVGASGKIKGIGVNAEQTMGFENREELDFKSSKGKTVDKKTGKDTETGSGTDTGTITHTGTDEVHTGTWNSESGYGGSISFTESETTRRAITELLSKKTGYGQSYIRTENSNETQEFSVNNTNTDEYSTVVTWNKTTFTSKTQKFSTANTKTGFHRWVYAGIAHVFAVVGYDIASQSYFVTNLSIMDDHVYRYEDYSVNSATYDDNQSSVIDFVVPTDIEDYVLDRITCSDGLVFSNDGTVTGYSGKDYTAIHYYVPVFDEETGEPVLDETGEPILEEAIGEPVFDEETGEPVSDGTTGKPIVKTVYEGPDDFVIIPEYKVITGLDNKKSVVKVTGISSAAFQNNDFVVGVELSDYIDTIPNNAFENCTNLQYVAAKSITSIGSDAFENCPGLKYAFIDDNITSLGTNAFGSAEEIEVMAANAAVVDAAIISGASTIVVGISDKCTDLSDLTLTVPETVELFDFYGFGKVFENVSIKSDAANTEIIDAEFVSTGKTPLEMSSSKVAFQEVKASAPGIALTLSAEDVDMALYGESFMTSSNENAMLCKEISLRQIGADLYSQLHVSGNILVCDEASDIHDNDLLDLTQGSRIISITAEEFAKYQRGVVRVTIDPNGGNLSQGEETKICFFGATVGGSPVDPLPIPTRDYYNFDGWYTDAEEGTRVTEDTPITEAKDLTLFAHWVEKDVSDWISASDLPDGAQLVDTKWTYTLRSYKESGSSALPGWIQYSHEISSYGAKQGPVYSYPSNDNSDRLITSESYVASYGTKHIWHFHKYGYYPLDYSYSAPSGGREEYHVYLDYYPTNAGQRPVAYENGRFEWFAAGTNEWAAVYFVNDYDETDYNKPNYATRWYYQDPVYNYYYYQDNELETTEGDPTGQDNVSNVVEWVRYRSK